jgi:hypothetical protein
MGAIILPGEKDPFFLLTAVCLSMCPVTDRTPLHLVAAAPNPAWHVEESQTSVDVQSSSMTRSNPR